MKRNYSEEVQKLFSRQLEVWEQASNHYKALEDVHTRTLNLDGFVIRVQFNPHRIHSSSAKVDTISLNARPCFLCAANRPRIQESLPFLSHYELLVNPFPIFPEHVSLVSKDHEVQRIEPHFDTMLALARELPKHTVIYNGPQCGASAPDHFHFQSVPSKNLPLNDEFSKMTRCVLQGRTKGGSLMSWSQYLRPAITLLSDHPDWCKRVFVTLLRLLNKKTGAGGEPMVNVLATLQQGAYAVHIFPRARHRPKCYYATGKEHILVSPASIDLGGVLILPRREDYEAITTSQVADIFQQVCLSEEDMNPVIQDLLKQL
jgi:ATP adenylyltransferase/5',5'''-P-1,P-4-tetraphosphate phosphorylase II